MTLLSFHSRNILPVLVSNCQCLPSSPYCRSHCCHLMAHLPSCDVDAKGALQSTFTQKYTYINYFFLRPVQLGISQKRSVRSMACVHTLIFKVKYYVTVGKNIKTCLKVLTTVLDDYGLNLHTEGYKTLAAFYVPYHLFVKTVHFLSSIFPVY